MYVAVATLLSVIPLLVAYAFSVLVDVNVRAELYAVLELVGVEPSVVYRIVAPEVSVKIATVTEPVKLLAEGLKYGVETVSVVPTMVI